MIDVTLGVFWDRGSRSLYKNVMFCTFFRLRNSQAKACGYLKEICNVGVNPAQVPIFKGSDRFKVEIVKK
jgi:hypothetical protein